jgi:hypothetical protein
MLRRISFVFLLLFSLTALADGIAGLTFYTYRGTGATPSYTNLTYPTVLSTGTSPNINYNWGSGAVLTSGRADTVMVHWVGYIQWPGTGNVPVTFYNSSDDGFILKVNGTTVINNWVEQGNAMYNSNGSITLTGGSAYYIDVWYYENGGGAAAQLYWTYSGQGITIVPATAYATSATYWAPTNPTTVGTSSGITQAQQTRKNNLITNRNSISGNQIYIDQAGDNNTINITQSSGNNSIQGINQQNALLKGNSNTVTIKQGNTSDPTGKNLIKLEMNTGSNSNQIKLYQGYNSDGTMNYSDGDGHIISLGLTGSSNQVNLYQTNLGANNAGHFAELNITGSTNNITVSQKGNGGKTFFGTVSGNGNTISALQDGLGQDYLNVNLTGNGHTVNASQSGAGNHLGYIDLTNAGGASTVNLTQSGSTAQSYSIIQTCVTVTGCSVTVTQP